MKTILFILTSVFLGVAGQMLLKMGLYKTPPMEGLSVKILHLIFKPYILLGFISYGLSSIFWLLVLSRTELSYAYPMVALGYVFVFIFSWLYFKDQVTLIRVIGLVLICIGVVFVAMTQPNTPKPIN
ncbi:MAG: transporter [Candidatus Coatesbacteria bacterium]|nr:MAG: transporter [Candidatus Coatesbacteria bacterium]